MKYRPVMKDLREKGWCDTCKNTDIGNTHFYDNMGIAVCMEKTPSGCENYQKTDIKKIDDRGG